MSIQLNPIKVPRGNNIGEAIKDALEQANLTKFINDVTFNFTRKPKDKVIIVELNLDIN